MSTDKTVMKEYGYTATCSTDAEIAVTKEECADYRIIRFRFSFLKKERKRKIALTCAFPAMRIAGTWTPICGLDRSIRADWSPALDTMMSISAPVTCFYDNSGRNVHTIAYSEVKQKLSSQIGIREEDGTILCNVNLDIPEGLFEECYEISVWESDKDEFYGHTIRKACSFWESREGYRTMPVPDAAREPLYSFWYSYHQEVNAENVLAESRLAADMGFSTIIVDDGWQTDDRNRGYAFCGDWQPSRKKFPDFPGHVKEVQACGLRYMIWFSVPYIGKQSRCFATFADKLLAFDEVGQTGIVDIRYPEVREYLIEKYETAVRDWGVDGLKLDFIDEFYIREDSPAYNEQMDHADVQEALGELLQETIRRLKAIKPDVLIEFRQNYVGPEIRRYGNLIRVVDCPGSALKNRVGTIDLRLTSGDTAVHSDMLMWNRDELVEHAALQLIACLFSNVQISVRLEELDSEKKDMLMFWLAYMKNHKKLLQNSELEAEQPQNLYPMIRAYSEEEEILVAHVNNQYLNLRGRRQSFFYINAGGCAELLVEGGEKKERHYRLMDCMGKVLEEGKIRAGEYCKMKVPEAAMLVFEHI